MIMINDEYKTNRIIKNQTANLKIQLSRIPFAN